MKRIFIAIILIFSYISVFAQNKGDNSIAGALAASFGNQTLDVSDGGPYSTSTQQPLSTSLSFSAEYSYFVFDKFRMSLGFAVPYYSTPTNGYGNVWNYTKTLGLEINPNIAYYVPLTDRLYYTPEVGYVYGFGQYKEQYSLNNTYKTNYTEWGLYVKLFAMEFQVKDKLAIGVGIGGLTYGNVKIKVAPSTHVSTSQLSFYLNNASVNVRLYIK